ncbi:MAG: CPXCG motif-containing cysteine-rich protein [Frateuria sp.]|uniref:CPXCG motif-containing cysteine-rich protein n=1 Tax=Frateuria sp. TaxID=2211372 RepID=UPI001807143F|nr:CPXCG motif-containing cysteine-rich protein [Frateuria sp.]NUO73589.1 CPXCG motif-containing cysteine-rich protein [Frateuria sp.]NUR21870.1 CPXCG motif-containing cysteine-rich protein [Frateuria sp.]
MLTPYSVQCPYCGEPIELLLDASAGDQSYVEDCPVCCRPINVRVGVDGEGDPWAQVAGENEG